MIQNVKLKTDEGNLLENLEKCSRAIEELNYLTITRPDITFQVSVISRFMSSPRTNGLFKGHDIPYN